MADVTTLSTWNLKPGPVEASAMQDVFDGVHTGVVSLCALVDGSLVGMIAASFVAVSVQPPMVAFCVQNSSNTWPVLASVPRVGVSVLSDQHGEAAYQLSSRTKDRFAMVQLEVSDTGAAFVADAVRRLECEVQRTVPTGDHTMVLLDVVGVQSRGGEPLVYHGRTFRPPAV